MDSIELFAGAGGLALATANAGFHHRAVLEWNPNACSTLRRNKAAGLTQLAEAEIVEGDISSYDFQPFNGIVDLISGGPPCQPFSIGGKHGGMDDRRNMFPHAIRSVRYEQSQSEWDVIHPGRSWTTKCKGKTRNREIIVAGIEKFVMEVGNAAGSPMDPSGGTAFS